MAEANDKGKAVKMGQTQVGMTLWDNPPVQSHSATSIQAGRSMAGKTGSLRAVVLNAIAKQAGTDEELADRLAMNPNTVRPRRVELAKAGLIKEIGTRPTKSGRKAVVWDIR